MGRIPSHREETKVLLEQQFKSEVALLSRLYHPNIVQFIAATKKPPVYCIITEHMSQGTLRMFLNKKQPYSLSTETILRESEGNMGTYRWMALEMIKEKAYTRKNQGPPLPASCQPTLAHLIKRCWAAHPSKRPDFSHIVSTLEKYDKCVTEGLPLSGLVSHNVILECLEGFISMSSSVPVHV
ncbi:hypothetical protein TEA_006435 [Camellia sinensis var. sinensis]|uniref:Serine-threonine/tyrosine-protein kinase catalytic domain-containing protein n=1 Tax=Camellia sinensis var. sinensis TaxID=542762 RepID=A0A4S4F1K9_CAMSN|nr:hypothetical protein TEA_006435 [Camellia sinensis var. sinensis]